MLTGELRSKIDKVWEQFWTGGLSNPITVIEQITYLLFIRRLYDIHTQQEQKAAILKKPIEDPIFTKKENELRWSYLKNTDPDVLAEEIIENLQAGIDSFRYNDKVKRVKTNTIKVFKINSYEIFK